MPPSKQQSFEAQLATTEAADRQTWRQWLQTNHLTSPGVWLIYYKVKSGQPSVQYSEAVQEALCFGWIDSKVKSLDEQRYQQIFTPRKPNSVWSKLNKHYVEQLLAAGLMTEAGLAKVQAAQADGSWTSLDAIEALILPPDLQEALAKQPSAQENFASFSKSTRKNILFWIGSAKRPATRLNRIQQTLTAALANRSPL
ncbi:MAG: YdeI/OmpD-associated family protein [Cyanobacteriota bacterium]|nr:YdeI/OmpD-associated family protein [Cyanobacteriota bacterium]